MKHFGDKTIFCNDGEAIAHLNDKDADLARDAQRHLEARVKAGHIKLMEFLRADKAPATIQPAN